MRFKELAFLNIKTKNKNDIPGMRIYKNYFYFNSEATKVFKKWKVKFFKLTCYFTFQRLRFEKARSGMTLAYSNYPSVNSSTLAATKIIRMFSLMQGSYRIIFDSFAMKSFTIHFKVDDF